MGEFARFSLLVAVLCLVTGVHAYAEQRCVEEIEATYFTRHRFDFGKFDAHAAEVSKRRLATTDTKPAGHVFPKTFPARPKPVELKVEVREADASGYTEVTVTDPFAGPPQHITLDAECKPVEPSFCTSGVEHEIAAAKVTLSNVPLRRGSDITRFHFYTAEVVNGIAGTYAQLTERLPGRPSSLYVSRPQLGSRDGIRQIDFDAQCRIIGVHQWTGRSDSDKADTDYYLSGEFCRSLAAHPSPRAPAAGFGVPRLGRVPAKLYDGGTWPQDLAFFLPDNKPAGSVALNKVGDARTECKRLLDAGLFSEAPVGATSAPSSVGQAAPGK